MKNSKGFLVLLPLVLIVILIVIGNKGLEKKNDSKYGDVSFNYQSDGSVSEEPLIIDNYDEEDYVPTTEEPTTEEQVTTEATTEEVSTEEVASETDASTEETTEEVEQSTVKVDESNFVDVVDSLMFPNSNYLRDYTTEAFKSSYVVPEVVGDIMGFEESENSSYSNGVVYLIYNTTEGVLEYKVTFTLSEEGLLDTWVVEKQ